MTETTIVTECSLVISAVQKLLSPCLGPQGTVPYKATLKNFLIICIEKGLSILVEAADGHASFMHNALQIVTALQYKTPVSKIESNE